MRLSCERRVGAVQFLNLLWILKESSVFGFLRKLLRWSLNLVSRFLRFGLLRRQPHSGRILIFGLEAASALWKSIQKRRHKPPVLGDISTHIFSYSVRRNYHFSSIKR